MERKLGTGNNSIRCVLSLDASLAASSTSSPLFCCRYALSTLDSANDLRVYDELSLWIRINILLFSARGKHVPGPLAAETPQIRSTGRGAASSTRRRRRRILIASGSSSPSTQSSELPPPPRIPLSRRRHFSDSLPYLSSTVVRRRLQRDAAYSNPNPASMRPDPSFVLHQRRRQADR